MINFSIKSAKAIHPYITGRIHEMHDGLYPKNHLWGIDIFDQEKKFPSRLIPKLKCPTFINRLFKKLLLSHSSPGLDVEFAALKHSYSSLIVYSVCGPLSLVRFFGKAQLFCWVFSEPKDSPKCFFHPYNPQSLAEYSGFLCLTPKAEKYFSQYAPAKFIPWCVDLEMFDGKPPKEKPAKSFFLASGKTGRDYHALVNAAYKTEAEIRIIGPKHQKPIDIPENVIWIDTSSDPPDQAIDYPTLKEWYAQCSGVCIPLSGDADDTCGYTNMLESMAMRKPVIMTRSGCLHIDPASRNFGILVEPGDSQGWSDAMNRILNDENFASECGEKGRKIAEEEFSIERFNRDVVSFINEVIKNA
jgi:glycosyltransferase involved in cell wall biosynthesis